VKTIDVCECETALGPVTAAVCDGRLVALTFSDRWPQAAARLGRRFGACAERRSDPTRLQARLERYFGGGLNAFDGIALDPGGTDFQRSVWSALREIPAGTTTSYSELARRIGAPSAVRAVGAANGANPIWLIIPCHRAIGANGDLTGYAGGLDRKRWLLRHEGALLA
jgi:methylated-DNA-[protein]-cysteine S-methyltransferase